MCLKEDVYILFNIKVTFLLPFKSYFFNLIDKLFYFM